MAEEKKYYEVEVTVTAYVTLGVHAKSEDEACDLFNEYLVDEGVDKWDIDNNEYDFNRWNILERKRPSVGSIDIDSYVEDDDEEDD